MTIEFKLPDLGEGISSADVASVLVAQGDTIASGQNVLELETDKAVVELPCPNAGKVAQIHVKAGDTVKQGDLLFTIEGSNGASGEKGGGSAAAARSANDGSEAAAATKGKPAAQAAPAKPAAAAKSEPPAEPPPAKSKPAAQAGGTVEFALPELGEGISSAEVASLLVEPGAKISAGQNVLELETDKAVVELPCPHAGTITKIQVKPGDSLKVGTPLMTIETQASAEAPATETPAAPARASAPAAKAAAPTRAAAPAEARPAGKPPTKAAPAAASGEKAETGENGASPAPAGPATRRLARELGVDLHHVPGSGPGGRITAEDVQAYVRERLAGAAARGGGAGLAVELPPLPDFSQWGDVERVAMNKIAKTTAANLTVAWQTIPHVTQHELADVTELEAGRKRHSQNKGAAKITMTVLAVKAVVAALKQYPHFNSSIDLGTSEVIHKHYYNIGVAVDTEQGLLVPVIKDANLKSVLEIAKELETLAGKARERKLAMSDFQGGTFTITNLGSIGGTSFTPIVNYPEVAILGMSRARQQYVVVDGKPEVRLMLPLSLSYDHRVVNGADAARFVVKVAGLLADPSQLLIES